MEILSSPSLKSSRNTKYHSKNLPQPQLSLYNEAIENNVRFVQGANAFIVLFGLYEILKSTYLTSVNSQTQDSAWSQYLPLLGLNILWIFVALMGIVAINSGSKSRVNKFYHLLILSSLSRGLFCLYTNNKSGDENNLQGAFYIVQTILETFINLVLVSFTRNIRNYLKAWEEMQ